MTDSAQKTAWLSHGLEVLIGQLGDEAFDEDNDGAAAHFDVVIVGSGYGGSVAAAELARCRVDEGTSQRALKVCLLERGREHLPGSFPGRMTDLAGHVRFASAPAGITRGRLDGLFDVRVGPDVSLLVANGLGGGSLINAGVMEMPRAEIFQEMAWPREIADDHDLADRAARMSARLGAMVANARNTVETASTDCFDGNSLERVQVMRKLAGAHPSRAAALTVALQPGQHTSAGVAVDACVGCGDCASGCNHNAKVSLDTNLLVDARRHGAQIFTGATVQRLVRATRAPSNDKLHDELHGERWVLEVWHTDEALRRRMDARPLRLRAGRVVLAAGTLGSTEILLRSRSKGHLTLSTKLGCQFSANGDAIAALYDVGEPAGGAPLETTAPCQRKAGPTITSIIDLRDVAGKDGDIAIEDMAVPAPLRRLMEEVLTTAASFDSLSKPDNSTHRPGDADPFAVDPLRIDRSLVVALIGRDSADGQLHLPPTNPLPPAGALGVHWPQARDDPRLQASHARLAALAQEAFRDRATMLPNPLWRLLPESEMALLGATRGALFTVHPLGGCPMGDSAERGVVNHLGQVFRGDRLGEVYPGLVVLDGSIIPVSLGINPSLTIATLAQRAIEMLIKDNERWGMGRWRYAADGPAGHAAAHPNATIERPRFRQAPTRADAGEAPPAGTATDTSTEIEVVERLSGSVPFGRPWADGRYHVELTLRYEAIAMARMLAPQGGRILKVADGAGLLRIFAEAPGRDQPERADEQALFIAPVQGQMRVLERCRSNAMQRRIGAIHAWLFNRGWREIGQRVADTLAGRGVLGDLRQWFRDLWHMASHAGEVRRFTYSLAIGKATRVGRNHPFLRELAGGVIEGTKTLTYDRRANPIQQLMTLRLTRYPLAPWVDWDGAVLQLDLPFLARQSVPLLRVRRQRDMPTTLIDLGSLGLYVLRILLHVHLWSFRLPDSAPEREPQRLPVALPHGRDTIVPEVYELMVDRLDDATPVHIRLTRYARPRGNSPPVLMIHGYSASGTTFAHPALEPSLASYLWAQGIDAWVLDLRSSAGMPTARVDWTFEQVGCEDIPAAVNFVCNKTGCMQVDVVAHCMGAAMFSMAVLDSSNTQRSTVLRSCVRRLVLSQAGPLMIFAPGNLLRAYVMRWVRYFLPDADDYQFRPPTRAGVMVNAYDRFLSAMPYRDPKDNFDRENPWRPWRRTPWVGMRHRMDALYGETFRLANLSDTVLGSLDDFFGPLSIDTVSQVIHFARNRMITDYTGFNRFVDLSRLSKGFGGFETLSVHGEENGLIDVATVELMQRAFEHAGLAGRYRKEKFAGLGHQDSLMGGPKAVPVFEEIVGFLQGHTR